MTQALMERESTALTVTSDQLDLVKRTVASGATDAELKLYLYDCQRQGVHPLDRLLHFTKRGGKYTPVTSIDLMRIRAAETGEYAGSDDATFHMLNVSEGEAPVSATVTVWRLVQGNRCAFTATARWSEYCPGQGSDHMWRKMPHTMLAKCAEALALRKGFPRQLAGLYAKEEMDQAGEPQGYTVEAPAATGVRENPSGRRGGDQPAIDASSSNGRTAAFGAGDVGSSPADAATLPDGMVYIERVDASDTKNKNVKRYMVTFSDGKQASTINAALAGTCEQACQDRTPLYATIEKNGRWENLIGITTQKDLDATKFDPTPDPMVEDIPF